MSLTARNTVALSNVPACAHCTMTLLCTQVDATTADMLTYMHTCIEPLKLLHPWCIGKLRDITPTLSRQPQQELERVRRVASHCSEGSPQTDVLNGAMPQPPRRLFGIPSPTGWPSQCKSRANSNSHHR
eukprot:5226398-Amphidinium_carterae.1